MGDVWDMSLGELLEPISNLRLGKSRSCHECPRVLKEPLTHTKTKPEMAGGEFLELPPSLSSKPALGEAHPRNSPKPLQSSLPAHLDLPTAPGPR